MKILLNVLLITLFFGIVVVAQTPNNNLDEQVKPIVASFKGR